MQQKRMSTKPLEIINIDDSDDESENKTGLITGKSVFNKGNIMTRRPKRKRNLSIGDINQNKHGSDSTTTENSGFDNIFDDDDDDDDDDDEVLIVEPPPKDRFDITNSMDDSPSRTSGRIKIRAKIKNSTPTKEKSASNNKIDDNQEGDDDTEIQVCGIVNSQVFVHMRQHCLKYVFIDKKQLGRKKNNKQFCDKCYCFVCDIPVKDCKEWDAHCGASDTGSQAKKWIKERESKKQKNQI